MRTWTRANYIDQRQSLSKMPPSLITETWSLEDCGPSFWSKESKIFPKLVPWTEWVKGFRIGESFAKNLKGTLLWGYPLFCVSELWGPVACPVSPLLHSLPPPKIFPSFFFSCCFPSLKVFPGWQRTVAIESTHPVRLGLWLLSTAPSGHC